MRFPRRKNGVPFASTQDDGWWNGGLNFKKLYRPLYALQVPANCRGKEEFSMHKLKNVIALSTNHKSTFFTLGL
jgi:hypothetical protein